MAEDVECWENYSTAEEDPEACEEILDTMVKKRWSIVFEEPSEAEAFLGVSGLVLNRLGLIQKVKPDGTVNHRIVWNWRRSGVSLVILQGERVVLPRIADIADSIREMGGSDMQSQDVHMLGTGISDAFHQVPLDEELAIHSAALRGKIHIFEVSVFGSASAPTEWGRYAAWSGTSTAAMLLDTACKKCISTLTTRFTWPPGLGRNARNPSRLITINSAQGLLKGVGTEADMLRHDGHISRMTSRRRTLGDFKPPEATQPSTRCGRP